MEKMLFSGVQSNSDVALIVIKGLKHQPGIAAKIYPLVAVNQLIIICFKCRCVVLYRPICLFKLYLHACPHPLFSGDK